MKTSQKGIDLIKESEGFEGKAYPDPNTKAAPYTIGYGTIRYPSGMPVRPSDVCTKEQAENYLKHDLERFEQVISDAVKVKLTQSQFDALVSIVYNVGPGSRKKSGIIMLKDGSPSTLLKRLNARDYTGAANEFLRWISPGSKVENGLRRRRTAERQLFLSKG